MCVCVCLFRTAWVQKIKAASELFIETEKKKREKAYLGTCPTEINILRLTMIRNVLWLLHVSVPQYVPRGLQVSGDWWSTLWRELSSNPVAPTVRVNSFWLNLEKEKRWFQLLVIHKFCSSRKKQPVLRGDHGLPVPYHKNITGKTLQVYRQAFIIIPYFRFIDFFIIKCINS